MGDESSDTTPGNKESMTRGRDRQESPKSAFDLLAESITLSSAESDAFDLLVESIILSPADGDTFSIWDDAISIWGDEISDHVSGNDELRTRGSDRQESLVSFSVWLVRGHASITDQV